MKKLFAAFVGLLVINSAFATVTAITQNKVDNVVDSVKNGVTGGAATSDGVLIGVTPQTTRLTREEGDAAGANSINNTAVGDLVQKNNEGAPTEKINANTDNLTVLKRDKLVIPDNPTGDGHCGDNDKCGYVTTSNDATANSTDNKVWVRITRCTGTGNNVTCNEQ